MSREIFHYCSVDSFVSILGNKCCRLSDLSKSNDYMERKWFLNVLEEALKDFFIDENINFDINEEMYYSENSRSHFEWLLEEIDIYMNQPSFVMCFSNEGDLLSQWRAYANDGAGLAIGFNFELFHRLTYKKSTVSFDRVLYKLQDQKEEIKYAASEVVRKIYEMFAMDYNSEQDTEWLSRYLRDEFEAFSTYFAEELQGISCIIKNPAFTEEKEFRVYYTPPLYDVGEHEDLRNVLRQTKKIYGFDLGEIKYWSRDKKIIGYTDLSYDRLLNKNIISSIVIGPCSKVTEKDIRFFLIKHGYNVDNIKISKSISTYQYK